MSESTSPVTELTSQYVSQVSNDLDNNVKEQDRIAAEISSLQGQLTALQHDHGVLVSMQQALGVTAPAGVPAGTDGAVVPAPRKTPSATPATPAAPAAPVVDKAPKKTGVAQPEATKRAAKKPAVKKSTAKASPAKASVPKASPTKTSAAKQAAPQTAQPTLVELVRRHLTDQKEPRSAAEVAEALGKAHPDREIQTKVIRTTLENLVARNSAQRSKQGTSVFYTVAPAAQSAAADKAEAKPETAA
ncbi:hypothetical protein [Streptomyces monashensis]|uniref:Regulatory protein n=1 Tax=Streptomyces monashensis TaxID=1678012 RepID=A0A1S2QB44_9ACTN|nr:hypothetical protein [Streptomyces monashensis]OIK02736.1 hypothetical protein BIV23_24250 [Streptomyces monashensis]